MFMVPSEPSQPPGGHHESFALKMRVANLGSKRRPVARAPAPGAVGAWTPFSEHGPSRMLIFARFCMGSTNALGHRLEVDPPMVFHGFCDIVSGAAMETSENTMLWVMWDLVHTCTAGSHEGRQTEADSDHKSTMPYWWHAR